MIYVVFLSQSQVYSGDHPANRPPELDVVILVLLLYTVQKGATTNQNSPNSCGGGANRLLALVKNNSLFN